MYFEVFADKVSSTLISNYIWFLLATVNILASDDGHGILSFNTTEHFLLREPTSFSSLSESVAALYVVRNPEEGTFGTITVQFTITDANGSLAEGDLRPAQGFVVLEDGVRFKVRESRFLLATSVQEKSCIIDLDQFSFSSKEAPNLSSKL